MVDYGIGEKHEKHIEVDLVLHIDYLSIIISLQEVVNEVDVSKSIQND